jgi:serine/threonine protein kinase
MLHVKMIEDKPLDQFIRCYGITQNPETKNYMMVMKYASKGNLRSYIKNKRNTKPYKRYSFDFKLRRKIVISEQIIGGLKRIHVKGFIHRDLHIGNIVCFNDKFCITDMGLCKPVNYKELENMGNNIYGALPYIAPEILRGGHYTQASDIYSFGIIMYEVISESPPYYGIDQDEYLAIRICEGLRPNFNIKLPQLILQLIKSCLDANPLNRPNAFDLSRIFNKWLREISAYLINLENRTELIKTEIVKQVEETEIINKRLSTTIKLPPTDKNFEDPRSKLLNFNNLPEPKNPDDYYSNYDSISSVEYSKGAGI